MLRKDNEKSRKTLEKSLKEYETVTNALQALEEDEEEKVCDDVNDFALLDAQIDDERRSKHKSEEQSARPKDRHVTFSAKSQDVTIEPVKDRKGEKEKRRVSSTRTDNA